MTLSTVWSVRGEAAEPVAKPGADGGEGPGLLEFMPN